MIRRGTLASLVVWTALVSPASAEVISTTPGVAYLDAFHGTVAWSSLDQSTGGYSLKALVGGRVQTLPVATRPVPFDVDLGPAGDGGIVAAYSRCERDFELGFGVYSRPIIGVGCRVFLYSFATGRERALPRAAGVRNEFSPAVWKDRLVVFSQRGDLRSPVMLRTRSLDARTAGHRLPAGSRGPSAGPVDVDVRDRRIVFIWQGVEGEPAAEDGRSLDMRTEVWTVTVGGKRTRLARSPADGDAPVIVSAMVLPDAVGYLRRSGGPYFVRVMSDGRRLATEVEETAIDVAFSLGRTFTFRRVANGPYEIAASEQAPPGP
ncbi:MAG: hypothetical protein AVDCRST_MAG30-1250 [uncultured Solirubrobacteraceae bacterium]|uniref:Uncharacterized protein n=1 Tax=uncultured Solirubrobacteraceae bacterium TaxID=1162706 RepID=A0A6J4SAF5_9ACTN|nr:MAG: hypothetical protein AVDCRST_MAG30-1250 [uncultured Solirubrobacteraceae bacterium]